MKECPFGYSNSVIYCSSKCMMYEDGCLIKEALKCYIDKHTLDPYRKTETELYEMLMNVRPSISCDDIPF